MPATAITYVLETVLAKYVLKEHVNWLRWAGASLVICGVALVSAVIWLAMPALAAACYYLLAIWWPAARWQTVAGPPQAPPRGTPPLSILKPVHGRDPALL